jgi:hypothetical protein
MVKPLDESAFDAYCRLTFIQEVQEMIAHIRASKRSGDQYSIRGSTCCVGYPSTKMGGILRAESRMLEFPSILELESSNEYVEDF